ncbi:MAG: DUF998 domain-containing protein [Clostridia bacterium]|nr:DUF998 domain-containing protein [Clostridia bacterium]
MHKKLIQWFGLTGIFALVSYASAVIFAPSAFPGYNWMAQAVSDLSASNAPSRAQWDRLSSFYNSGSIVCATCTAIYVSEQKGFPRLFRTGIYLFTIMNWVSCVGYAMFPLSDTEMETVSFQDIMHILVTAFVVLLSVASLICMIIAGCREQRAKGIGIWASVALLMMLTGAIGQGIVPPEYFGIVERFSVFAAVGFNAILGIYLFQGFPSFCRMPQGTDSSI